MPSVLVTALLPALLAAGGPGAAPRWAGLPLAVPTMAAAPATIAPAATVVLPGPPAPRATPRDRAATSRYIAARIAYYRALIASAPASLAAQEAVASRIAGECPGVLSGAPETLGVSTAEPLPGRAYSPRHQGEANRAARQRFEVTSELGDALGVAGSPPLRAATIAYVRATRALRWSDPRVTRLVDADAADLAFYLSRPPPAVCADLAAWHRSGFKRLAPATKALARETALALAPLLEALIAPGPAGIPDPVRYARGPSGRARRRLLARLRREAFEAADKGQGTRLRRLEHALDPAQPLPEARPARPRRTVIARARTAAGRSYTIAVEARQRGDACPISADVEERSEEGAFDESQAERSLCLSRTHPVPIRTSCAEGVLAVQGQTLPAARRVTLYLSDGRQITSKVARVPRRLGGPAGYYLQELAAPSAHPVSLAELDARGRVIRRIPLAHTARCLKRRPPRRVLQTIVRGRLPDRSVFAIVGGREGPGRRAGLRLAVLVPTELLFELGAGSPLPGAPRHRAPGPFHFRLFVSCQPSEQVVVYGVLRDTRDAVLARTAAGVRRLRTARIPRALSARGVVAYRVLSSVPRAVIVRAPGGRVVSRRDLARVARNTRERCEAEAEM